MNMNSVNPSRRICVYAGSFDPLTNGHLWMIREGSKLFDELVVAIGIHPAKKYDFPLEDRLNMLKTSLTDAANVTVSSFCAHFLADYARQVSAGYILRGIRGESDYEYERGMRYVNQDLNPGLTTIFLIPPREMVEVSSSMVKGLIGPAGWESVVGNYVPAPVYQKILDRQLSRSFLVLWHRVTGGEGAELYAELSGHYSEPQRHYHTLAHIAACLSELEQLPLCEDQRQRIGLAIWFHDVIYDPLAKDNEAQSAEFFRKKAVAAGMATALVEEVSGMIEATRKHEAANTEERATSLFIDIDLAILGAIPERFQAYDEAIRREYSAVPGPIYGFERKRIMKQFLNRKTLFCTPEFRSKYEQQARENLLRVVNA